MIEPRFIVGFTGHRSLGDPVREARVTQSIERALIELKERVGRAGGRLEFYGSIAYGADTLAVEQARKLGIPVHLILPKPVLTDPATAGVRVDAGFAADFHDESSDGRRTFRRADWDRAWRQIQDARTGVDGGTLRIVAGSHQAPECYYDAGLQVLEASDVLLAVWDHGPERGLGGAAQIVRLAKSVHMPSIVVSAIDGTLESEGLERLSAADEGVQVIAEVDRSSAGCAVATSTAGPKAGESSRDATIREVEGPQQRERPRPDGVVAPATTLRPSVAASAAMSETADEVFGRLEQCSNDEALRFRNSLVLIIKAHGAASLVAGIAAILPQTPLAWSIALASLASVEVCLVAWALRRSRGLSHGHVHERWMQTRFAAELMRGLRDSGGLLDPLHPLVARHHPKWRRFALTAGLLVWRSRPLVPDWRVARDAYVRGRLLHADITIGQVTYFARKQEVAETHFRKTVRWGTRLGRSALLFVVGALLYKCWGITAKILEQTFPAALAVSGGDWKSWLDLLFKFLPIALPLLAGVFIALRTALDSGRRTYRYQELADRLRTTAAAITMLETEAAVRRHVVATEEVLLDELIEWHLTERQNGAH